MSDTNTLLSEALEAAKIVLGGLIKENEEGDFFSFNTSKSEEDSRADDFKKDLSFIDPSSNFEQIKQLLKEKRSTFLPYELILNNQPLSGQVSEGEGFEEEANTEQLNQTVQDNLSVQEPYLNTFMRLLGMPPHNCDELVNENILNIILGDDSGYSPSSSPSEISQIVEDYLNSRFEYDFNNPRKQYLESSFLPESKDDLSVSEILKTIIVPVQDGRISSCINEPDKIVPPPFSNRFSRVVNSNTSKPTLLEAIIRIRLDRFSGTSNVTTGGTTPVLESFAEEDSDRYGIVESLFIYRLQSAMRALAKKQFEVSGEIKVKLSQKQASQVNQDEQASDNEQESITPETPNSSPDFIEEVNELIDQAKATPATSDLEASSSDSKQPQTDEDRTKIKAINDGIAVEEAMLSILGESSDIAINYEIGTIRNTAIHSAYLISPALSVVKIPLDSLNKRLKEFKEKNPTDEDKGKSNSKNATGSIGGSNLFIPKECASDFQYLRKTFGTEVGIGVIDVTAYTLALFSMPEQDLLGLLTQKQFDSMKNGDFAGLIPPGVLKKNMPESLKTLSDYLKEAYNLFFQD